MSLQDTFFKLRTADVRQKSNGSWYVSVHPESCHLKTATAIQNVPLHSALIDAGFLEYVTVHTGTNSSGPN